jgi:hypothetical protein
MKNSNPCVNTNWKLALLAVFCATIFCRDGFAAQPNLQERLKDTDVAAHWIYDNYTQAVARATMSGKPLLVTFRCVP